MVGDKINNEIKILNEWLGWGLIGGVVFRWDRYFMSLGGEWSGGIWLF